MKINNGGLYLVICGVDEDFVDDLEETRHVFDLSVYHTIGSLVVGPHELCDSFYAPNVRIWAFQDVLELR